MVRKPHKPSTIALAHASGVLEWGEAREVFAMRSRTARPPNGLGKGVLQDVGMLAVNDIDLHPARKPYELPGT